MQADTLFDFPGLDSGWAFGAVNGEGEFELGLQQDRDPQSSTQGSLLAASTDAYCEIGRDMWHPGYSRYPALRYVAPTDGYYRLSIGLSPVSPLAPGAALATLIMASATRVLGTANYGQMLRVDAMFPLAREQPLVVSFRSTGKIDNLRCWYEAHLDGPVSVGEAYCRVETRGAVWQRYEPEFRPAEPDIGVRDLARQFEASLSHRVYGEPKFFSTDRS